MGDGYGDEDSVKSNSDDDDKGPEDFDHVSDESVGESDYESESKGKGEKDAESSGTIRIPVGKQPALALTTKITIPEK